MTDEILTIRTPKTGDRPYFSMARETAQDKRLSWEARGVLAYLLSKPDDWQVMVKDLQQQCGRDKVKKILKELVDCRYLKIHSMQHDEKGKFAQNQYQVFETPFTENPSTDSPSTANPSLTYNREIQITDNTPATKSRSKSKSSGNYPTSTKRWNREHALRYWQENKSPLDTLATAWGRDLKFCDSMSKFEMVEFIDTYRDLMDSGVGCDKFESLATFTRAKMSWKGAGMRPVEMVKLVTQWRESHVVAPAKPAMTESMIMNAAIFAEGKI